MDKLITINAFAFYGITILGIVAHAVKKWGMKEIPYSVYAYLFSVDTRGSMVTVGTALGAVITAVGSGGRCTPIRQRVCGVPFWLRLR